MCKQSLIEETNGKRDSDYAALVPNKRFSIIVPVYNSESRIQSLIESIFLQGFASYEIIVVDDASTDNTLSILHKLQKEIANLVLVTHDQKLGLHRARMSGVEHAHGELILFLQPDDILEPNALFQLDRLAQCSDADIMHFGVTHKPHGSDSYGDSVQQQYLNNNFGTLTGDQILKTAFIYPDIQQDRFLHSKLYRAPLIKEAFARMTLQALQYEVDAYEYFIITSIAQKLETHNNIRCVINRCQSELREPKYLTFDQYFLKKESYEATGLAAVSYIKENYDNNLDFKFAAQKFLQKNYVHIAYFACTHLKSRDLDKALDFALDTKKNNDETVEFYALALFELLGGLLSEATTTYDMLQFDLKKVYALFDRAFAALIRKQCISANAIELIRYVSRILILFTESIPQGTGLQFLARYIKHTNNPYYLEELYNHCAAIQVAFSQENQQFFKNSPTKSRMDTFFFLLPDINMRPFFWSKKSAIDFERIIIQRQQENLSTGINQYNPHASSYAWSPADLVDRRTTKAPRKPLFSVVIPAYNAQNYINRSVQSVLEQSYDNLELIVVDDSSTDDTAEILQNIKKHDMRLRVIQHSENMERHLSRRDGVKAARGSWILFLDADDEMMPETLEKIKRQIRIHKDADMIYFSLLINAVNMDPVGVFYMRKQIQMFNIPELTGDVLIAEPYIQNSKKESWHKMPYRVPQNAYWAPLAKKAFKRMEDIRLGRGEDSYEYFCFASLANKLVCDKGLLGMRYNYGLGMSNNNMMAYDDFITYEKEMSAAAHALLTYVKKTNPDNAVWKRAARENRTMLNTFILHEAFTKVFFDDFMRVLNYLFTSESSSFYMHNSIREIKDLAYEQTQILLNTDQKSEKTQFSYHELLKLLEYVCSTLLKHSALSDTDQVLMTEAVSNLYEYLIASTPIKKAKEKLIKSINETCNPFFLKVIGWRLEHDAKVLYEANGGSADVIVWSLKDINDFYLCFKKRLAFLVKEDLPFLGDVEFYQNELEKIISRSSKRTKRVKKTNNENGVQLLVSTQKDVDKVDSSVINLIQVGANDSVNDFNLALKDNSGNNISNLNPFLCEMTAQYWARYNTTSNYIGFMHYRRYFNFSDTYYQENEYGEIIDKYIDLEAQRKYALYDETIIELCKHYDIITSERKDISNFPESYTSIWNHYERAPHLFKDDLLRMVEIIQRKYPEYHETVQEYLNGTITSFCNMYILRRDLFNEYFDWMYPILDTFMHNWNMNRYSIQGLRTPGHLAERLWNIWLNYQIKTRPELKVKDLQVINFEQPKKSDLDLIELQNTSIIKNGLTVPIVFAANNAYVPMVGTTIYSLLVNASEASFYDIYILETDIDEKNKTRLQALVSPYKNARLTFINTTQFVSSYNLSTANEHISKETYYRFLVQELLPFYDKVIYLDSDLIILDDIAKLYKLDLDGNLLAAALDLDFLGNVNKKDTKRYEYATEVLKMKDPYSYFQAGVLILNTEALRNHITTKEWIEFAEQHPDYIYNDQDMLNSMCEGRVVTIPQEWNLLNNAFSRYENIFSFAPKTPYVDFLNAQDNVKILHYAGIEKPWRAGHCHMRSIFFEYAKGTPFYEELLAMLLMPANLTVKLPSRNYRNRGFLRKIGMLETPTLKVEFKKNNDDLGDDIGIDKERYYTARNKDINESMPVIDNWHVTPDLNRWSKFIDTVLPTRTKRRLFVTKLYRYIKDRWHNFLVR